MQPLADWPIEERRHIVGVFTDIDDTLTTDGVVPPATVQALADLRAAGLHVVPITGRPVGWSEPFARAWAVDAIVAENGAVALSADATAARGLCKRHQQGEATRKAQYERMQQVGRRLLREVPGAMLSRDHDGRETDIAIDHSEFTHLPQAGIDAVVRIMQAEGMKATVSSIHINGWFGDHDKWQGACWIVRTLWSRDLAAEVGRWAYVGDSTNDQVMFERFVHSVGVANIRRFEGQLVHRPRYITQAERGEGFNEFARLLLASRT